MEGGGGDKHELGRHQTTEGLMVLIRDVVVALVIMVLQIAHVCELAVASWLICVLQGTFSVTDGYRRFCSKSGDSACETKRKGNAR